MVINAEIVSVRFSSGTWSAILAKDSKTGKRFSAAGTIINPVEGTNLNLSGDWHNDPKYGEQFKVTKSEHIAGSITLSGLVSYLSSGYIKGVGVRTAENIVDKFGLDTIRIIETNPERLEEIKGISHKKAESIAESHKSYKIYSDLYDVFNGNITDIQVRKIYDTYGNKSIEVIKKNPYQLIYDIDGFGFKKVDTLALSYGVKLDSDERIAAAITFVLNELADKGHCYSSVDSVQGHLEFLVGLIDVEKVADIILKEIAAEHLVLEDERLYTKPLYEAENKCAKIICKMLRSRPVKIMSEEQIEDGIGITEHRTGFKLETKQADAVRLAINNRLSVITGGPGTGKTTIIQAILNAWDDDKNVYLVAPTGKASRRMSEVCNGMPATTIHRLLFSHEVKKEPVKMKNSLIIADEASMLDIYLASRLLGFADETNSALVLIGDIDQLPPIGAGNFFRDMVQSPLIPTVTLELSHRQKGKIAINAARINAGGGMGGYAYDESFQFIAADKENAQESVLNAYYRLVKEYGIKDVCCIVPMRKDSKYRDPDSKKVASDTLNWKIREHLNPEMPRGKKLKGCIYRVGDRVMQTINDYKREVFNGDCGTVTDIDIYDDLLYVEMDDGKLVEYSVPETQALVLAYAMTVHKSQGSEYKAIVLAQCWEHYIMLQRNLLYTGVTRAREKVVLVGDARAVETAVRNVPALERNTYLRFRIKNMITA